MNTVEKDQLICFMYLLTRGTPNCPGLPWGRVKELVRECGAPPRDNIFTSKAGEALAVELAHELLTGERPDLEVAAQAMGCEECEVAATWNSDPNSHGSKSVCSVHGLGAADRALLTVEVSR